MSKYPETTSDAGGFGPIPTPKKTGQTSFNEAMNAPNNPTKDHQPSQGDDQWNVSDAYGDNDSDD